MYTASINGIQFKGYTRYMSCNSEGKGKTLSDCPFGTAKFGDTRGLVSFVKKHSYPNAEVEETIGKIHDNVTGRVYVADPKEVVDDLIKLHHDYIVYDFEPDYPDVKENFYEGTFNKKSFENIKRYLKRLEAVEVKNAPNPVILQTSLEDLKKRFIVLEECSKIYSEGDSIREQKEDYERKIQARKTRLAEIEECLPKYIKELEKQKNSIKNHQLVLTKKEAKLSVLNNRKALFAQKGLNTAEEADSLNKKIDNTERRIEYIVYQLDRRTARVDFLEKFIESAPQRISAYRREIAELTDKLHEISCAAEPYIRKLCEVYTQNGIKIVKRI